MRTLRLILPLIFLLAACNGAPVPQSTASQDAPPTAVSLPGDLLYMAFVNQQPLLLRHTPATDERTVLFAPSEFGWLTHFDVSPDGEQIVLAYTAENQALAGFTDLYVMPADGTAAPTPLLSRAQPSETYTAVSWPLQDYVYYVHVSPAIAADGLISYQTQIERLHIPTQKVELVAEEAAWPRLSDDGSQLAYVTLDNNVMLAAPDGSNATVLLAATAFPAIDAPIFSADGRYLYFSATETAVSHRPLWQRLLGVQSAAAHAVPSDWWRVPLDSSAVPQQLTQIGHIGMYGDFSPDGRYLAFISTEGLQVMMANGSQLLQLNEQPAIGTISWQP